MRKIEEAIAKREKNLPGRKAAAAAERKADKAPKPDKDQATS